MPSLEFKLKLEIAGADISIENLDIEFEIIKTNTSELNKSTITIYNVQQETYNILKNKTTAVRLWSKQGESEYSLLFEGYPTATVKHRKNTSRFTKKGKLKKNWHYKPDKYLEPNIQLVDTENSDIQLVMDLLDSKTNYRNAIINKSYKGNTTSTKIINDCISLLGLPVSRISSKLRVKTFYNFIARGKVKDVLNQVTRAIGAKWSLQNGNIQILSNNETMSVKALILNSDNCQTPEFQDDKDVVFSTKLLPFVLPADWVSVDFSDVSGNMPIWKVEHKGSNFGSGETRIYCKV